jgi:hypothetical protein
MQRPITATGCGAARAGEALKSGELVTDSSLAILPVFFGSGIGAVYRVACRDRPSRESGIPKGSHENIDKDKYNHRVYHGTSEIGRACWSRGSPTAWLPL